MLKKIYLVMTLFTALSAAKAASVSVRKATEADHCAMLLITDQAIKTVINPCLEQAKMAHGASVSMMTEEETANWVVDLLACPPARAYVATDSKTNKVLGYAITKKLGDQSVTDSERSFVEGFLNAARLRQGYDAASRHSSEGATADGFALSDVMVRAIFIDENARGKGVGAQLLASIIADYPEAEAFGLCCVKTNESAIKFYTRLGFSDVEGGGDKWLDGGRIRLRVTREVLLQQLQQRLDGFKQI